MTIKTLRSILLSGLALALAGCGSLLGKEEPSRGDLMIAKGEAVSGLGEMWNEGSEMVKRADSLAAEGARLKKRGEKNVDEGSNLAARAKLTIEEKQREYARFGAGFGPLVSLDKARARRDALDRLVEEWQGAWNRLNEGRELIDKGRSRIAEGEAKLAEADRLTRRGRQLMQKAEQRYNSGAVPAQLTQ